MDKYAVEAEPSELALPLQNCLENKRTNDACTASIGVKARHIKVVANGAAGSQIARKGKVSSVAEVINCVKGMDNLVLCIGYKGESIRNVHLLVS